MTRLSIHSFLIILFIFIKTSPLSAASETTPATTNIQTLDGKILTSQSPVRLESPSSLIITPASGQPVKINLASILSARFAASSSSPSQIPAPQPWKSRDIGPIGAPGASRLVNNALTVRASGADIGAREDAFHFVHQPVTGNCEIVARLVALQKTDPLAKAGLMLRSTITPNSPFIMIAVTPDGNASLLFRKVPGQASHSRPAGRITLPAFLKLTRAGEEITIHHSPDARDWQPLINDKLPLTPALLAGVAVTSRNNSALTTATFERLSLSTAPTTPPDTSALSPQNPRGVLLRNGSFLAAKIRVFNSTSLRIPARSGQPEVSIPFTEVSRIIFTTPSRSAIDKLFINPAASLVSPSPTRAGALLGTDDFLEGTLTPLDQNRLRLSSVLFGLREFQVGELAVASFRDPAPAPTLFLLRTTDGSLFLTDRITIDKNHFLVEVLSLGQIRLPLPDLLELRAGPSRFIPLIDLKPTITTPAHPPASAPYSTHFDPSPAPGAPSHTLTLSAGASITYALDAKYRVLTFRLSTPPNRLPASTLHLTLSSNGKPLYSSPAITSLSDSIQVSLPVDGLNDITLSVTSDTPLAPDLLLSEPALIK